MWLGELKKLMSLGWGCFYRAKEGKMRTEVEEEEGEKEEERRGKGDEDKEQIKEDGKEDENGERKRGVGGNRGKT